MSERQTPPRRAWPRGWLLATGIGLLLVCTAVGWVQMRQVALVASAAQDDRENLAWSFHQIESGLLVLRDQLRDAQLEPSEPIREVVTARMRTTFGAVRGHLAQVQAPRDTRQMPAGPDQAATLAALADFTRRHTPTLAEPASRPLTREAVVSVLADLSGLVPQAHALTLHANEAAAALAEQRHAEGRAQARLSVALAIFQSLLTLTFALLTLRQFRSLALRRRDQQQVADTLREAQAEAEAASQAKSAFLANMSHELRTPFNGMLGMLALLDSDRLDAEQADYLRTARESASHLLDLLDDILDISKLESGRLAIVPHPLDIQRLLRDVHGLMALSADAKGLVLRVHVAPELPRWVMADGKRLKQILFNLMANAVKFTDEGEVSLTVTTRPAPADALGAEPMHELRFVVRDSGIGMSEAARARLFQRFSQGDSSTSRRFGGTGLGLEISRSLARMMGGDITVDSKPGLGSVFTLSLDLPGARPGEDVDALDRPGALAPLEGSAPAGTGQGLDLVVADDHPVNRKFLAILLRRMGHRVRLASNGAEAVAMVTEQVPDLVFMDLHMPVQDGMQATRTLRAGPPAVARVPIVALTADAYADTRARVLGAGMNFYLSKPVQPDDIEALLSAMFGARALAGDTDGAEPDDALPASQAPGGPPTDQARPDMTAALMPPSAATATAPAPVAATERRRFRTSDVVANLDMSVIGDVCVGVTLAGYQSVLTGFLDDEGGSAANLLAALDRGDTPALKSLAHAVKGASASMGLRALNALAYRIESEGAGYDGTACAEAAAQVRDLLATARALLQRMGFVRPGP